MILVLFLLTITPSLYGSQVAQQPKGTCGDLFIELLNPLYNNKPIIGFIKRKHICQLATAFVLGYGLNKKKDTWIGTGIFMGFLLWYYCNYKWWEVEEELNILKANTEGLSSIAAQFSANSPHPWRPQVA